MSASPYRTPAEIAKEIPPPPPTKTSKPWPKPPEWAAPMAMLCTTIIAIGWLTEVRCRTDYPWAVGSIILSALLVATAFFCKLMSIATRGM